MALNELRIVVVDGTGVGGTGGGRGDGEPQEGRGWRRQARQSKLNRALNYGNTIKRKIAGDTTTQSGAMKLYAINMGIGLATSTAKQWVNFHLNDIGRRHGDSNYQARVNRQIERVNDITGFGTSALQGAAAGAIFGPKGALVGAAVGAISHGIGLGFRNADRQRAYAHTMFEENNNQAVGLSRAGYSATDGRMRLR